MNGRSGQDWHVANLELSWKAATVLAGGLAVSVPLLRSARRPHVAATARFTQETALILALFALWQFAGSFGVLGPGGALARADWLWHAERVARLPSEAGLQHAFLAHPLLACCLTSAVRLHRDNRSCPVCRRDVRRPPRDDLRVPVRELEDTGGGRGVQYGVAGGGGRARRGGRSGPGAGPAGGFPRGVVPVFHRAGG